MFENSTGSKSKTIWPANFAMSTATL